MTLEEALAYPVPANCPSGPGTTVGTATAADWEWLAAQREREGNAILEAPLPVFMSVKDELVAATEARQELELACYVVGEHVKKLEAEGRL